MTNRNTTRPTTLKFKTTYLSDVGIRTLGNHALSLPAGDAARATIRLLIERWVEQGCEVEFVAALKGGPNVALAVEGDAADPLGEIHAILDGQEWDSDTAASIADVLTRNGYTISEPTDAFDGLEDVMQEAA